MTADARRTLGGAQPCATSRCSPGGRCYGALAADGFRAGRPSIAGSGRGFLRLVTEPMPARKHARGIPDPPPAPAAPGPTITEAPRRPEQLSLFDPPDGA